MQLTSPTQLTQNQLHSLREMTQAISGMCSEAATSHELDLARTILGETDRSDPLSRDVIGCLDEAVRYRQLSLRGQGRAWADLSVLHLASAVRRTREGNHSL